MIKRDKDNAIKYANIAIDINSKKIVPKLKNDDIFIPIIAKISIPFNVEDNNLEKENKLKEKEIKAKKHLEDMFEITSNLSYDDIKLLKNYKIKKEKNNIDFLKNENQREIE